MKLSDIQKVHLEYTPNEQDVAEHMRMIAINIKELVLDIEILKGKDSILATALKGMAVSLIENSYNIKGYSPCDICSDCHHIDNIPLRCQSGDGE